MLAEKKGLFNEHLKSTIRVQLTLLKREIVDLQTLIFRFKQVCGLKTYLLKALQRNNLHFADHCIQLMNVQTMLLLLLRI